jgi:hypothetical protein
MNEGKGPSKPPSVVALISPPLQNFSVFAGAGSALPESTALKEQARDRCSFAAPRASQSAKRLCSWLTVGYLHQPGHIGHALRAFKIDSTGAAKIDLCKGLASR